MVLRDNKTEVYAPVKFPVSVLFYLKFAFTNIFAAILTLCRLRDSFSETLTVAWNYSELSTVKLSPNTKHISPHHIKIFSVYEDILNTFLISNGLPKVLSMHVIEQYLCVVQEWNLFKHTYTWIWNTVKFRFKWLNKLKFFWLNKLTTGDYCMSKVIWTDFVWSIFAVLIDNYNISRYVELLLISPNKPVIELNNLREVHNQ